MHESRFDHLARALHGRLSRRNILSSAVGTCSGLFLAHFADEAAAKKKRRKRKKKRQNLKPFVFNEYGCVDVGKPCRGNDAKCCSGICQGRKPKKGQKDKSHCVAHDEGGCPATADTCIDIESTTCPAGGGFCYQTTGKGSICGGINQACATCKTDADCVALGFGEGAGCIVCPVSCPMSGTACVSPPA